MRNYLGALALIAIAACAGTADDELAPAVPYGLQYDAAYGGDAYGGGGGGACGDGVCDCAEVAGCPYDCADAVACCGDLVCGDGERADTCPDDCGCGDGVCDDSELEAEEVASAVAQCWADCGCGNGTCNPGEDLATCPADCGCGDGACDGDEDESTCPGDCFCGNDSCDPGETAVECADDCYCGDGACDDSEEPEDCPEDCDPCDGDGSCDCGETSASCPGDCGPACPDDPDETEPPGELDADHPGVDPLDCGECGDGVLECGEIGRCPEDEGLCGSYGDGDGEPAMPTGCCGNGVTDAGEDCDAGSDNGADGVACTETCELRSCGDGVLDEDLGEECEPAGEGNCSPSCEACWGCDSDEGETCDDGNDVDGDCCSADGQVEPCCQCDWQQTCDGEWTSVCSALGCVIGQSGGCGGSGSCGDGILELGEQCDDGNTDSDDGCDGGCGLESGFTCAQVPADPSYGNDCDEQCALTTVCVPSGCEDDCPCGIDGTCDDDGSCGQDGFLDDGDDGVEVISAYTVPPDACGDWICEPEFAEDFNTCPFDCWPVCGDGFCADGFEWWGSCPSDCAWQIPAPPGPYHGDGNCYLELCADGVPDPTDDFEAGECGSCSCGDYVCSGAVETEYSCGFDCAELYPAPVVAGEPGPPPPDGITF